METYKDKLAPWEKKNAYYNGVVLGKKVKDMKAILKGQTEEVIAAQIDSAEEIVVGQGIIEDVLQELDYNLKSVGQGICIAEGLLFAICFYINVIQPQSQWSDISTKQSEKDKIEEVVKKL